MAGERVTRVSAGIAVVRQRADHWELLLVHPGGPYWANKDEHAWSIPKGEVDHTAPTPPTTATNTTTTTTATGPDLAELEATARREFTEETGHPVPPGMLRVLPALRIGSGKWLHAFLVEGDLDPAQVTSQEIEIEWPPRSDRLARFPEVDRAAWFDLTTATTRLHKGQMGLVALLAEALGPPAHPR